MGVTVIPIVTGALGTIPKEVVKELEDFDIRVRVDTIQTTEILRSARIVRKVLRRLAVTQTPVKDHQLRLVRKTHKEYTVKSLGDLRRLAVTQTPVKNHQLTLV